MPSGTWRCRGCKSPETCRNLMSCQRVGRTSQPCAEACGPTSGAEPAAVGRLTHARIEFADAAAFVSEHHRHHTPPVGHVFSIGAYRGDLLVGVVIVGRPVARARDDGQTAEVTRLCVSDGERNACSFLYGKAAKAALAMGFRRIGTYTLARESGASLPPHRQASDRGQDAVGGRMTPCLHPKAGTADRQPGPREAILQPETTPSTDARR